MFESVSGIFVFKCVVGLWGREAKNAILYLYRKALILASELIRPDVKSRRGSAFDIQTEPKGEGSSTEKTIAWHIRISRLWV